MHDRGTEILFKLTIQTIMKTLNRMVNNGEEMFDTRNTVGYLASTS